MTTNTEASAANLLPSSNGSQRQPAHVNEMQFSFSDTIAGRVTFVDADQGRFGLRTYDGREFQVDLTPTTYAELIRNLGDPYVDATGQLMTLLVRDQFLFAYGVFYPQHGGHVFEAKHIVFPGLAETDFAFEQQDWWIRQVHQLADFYLTAQFGDGPVDYRKYRTTISTVGSIERGAIRQEVDTISRLIYGFASAYLMTGDDRYLEGAEQGTTYLREHLRAVDNAEGVVYWYHALDLGKGKHERKILASEFGDDYEAIPMYEQIYALAGPTQTYRITGDPRIMQDIEGTIALFNKFFLDRQRGGYFSHVDPVTFDPRAESLGRNRARKNWNSVGDHAPAYLINLWLATGKDEYADMLADTADTIEAHFPDYEHSPFVQEKFHEDWSHDTTWGWQQNRAVVGHNLKIAWNLMRIHHLRPSDKYVALAEKIATIMPTVGMDVQRGGWYDAVERVVDTSKGETQHRFVWHDRKTWWQQEQGILAYLILAGSLKKDEYARLARESAAFYNAWFLDHDEGGVYFHVLNNGLPYLVGTERLKGSHALSGYHSFELAYLAAVYTNLLITKQPMDFHFKPRPDGSPDRTLRVQPDILPPGSIKIGNVWINGEPYEDFDAEAMTIKLPAASEAIRVRVRVVPTRPVDEFEVVYDHVGDVATLTLTGRLQGAEVQELRDVVGQAVAAAPRRLILDVTELDAISSAGVRVVVFARHRLDVNADVVIVGAKPDVRAAFEAAEIAEDVLWEDRPDPTETATTA